MKIIRSYQYSFENFTIFENILRKIAISEENVSKDRWLNKTVNINDIFLTFQSHKATNIQKIIYLKDD